MATFAFPTSLKADDPLAIPFADADLSPSGAFAEGTGPDKPKDEQGKEAFACTIPGCLQVRYLPLYMSPNWTNEGEYL